VDFYHGILGFDIMGRSSNYKMAFVSAGGYHHHIGLNAWQGEGAPFAPADALGLKYFTVKLPTEAALSEVITRVENAKIPYEKTEEGFLLNDPSKNGVLLRNF
jgi:catechol 2,3-dioxygenase